MPTIRLPLLNAHPTNTRRVKPPAPTLPSHRTQPINHTFTYMGSEDLIRDCRSTGLTTRARAPVSRRGLIRAIDSELSNLY